MRIVIFIFCFFGLSLEFFAQSYITSIHTYGVEDGMSSRNVNCLLQDSKNFIWIGTNNGLNRFDGTRFKTYTREENGLSNNSIHQIAEDDEANLWLLYGKDFGESTTLDIFNPTTEQRQSATRSLQQQLPFHPKNIAEITQHNKTVWITTFQGEVFSYRDRRIELKFKLEQRNVSQQFFPTFGGGGWLVTKQKLFKLSKFYELEQEISINFNIDRVFSTNSEQQPYLVVVDDQAVPNGADSVPVYLYLGEKRIAQFPNDYTNIIAIDLERKEMWLTSSKNEKVVVSDFKAKILESKESGFERDISFLEYLQAQLWYYYKGEQITLAQTNITPFSKYLHNKQSIYNRNYGVRGMQNIGDSLLLVSGLGYSYNLNLKNKNSEQFARKLVYYDRTIDKDFTNGLAIMKDRTGNFWMTDEKIRLIKYNAENGIYKQFKYTESLQKAFQKKNRRVQDIQPAMQWSLFEDLQGKIWIGHKNGLSYLENEDSNLKIFGKFNEFEKFKGSSVFHFHPTEKGAWLATSEGLFELDTEKGIVDWAHADGDEKHRIPHNTIAHIFEDEKGNFWLASKGGGLIWWNRKTGKTQQFTTKQGLSDNIIYAVYGDNYGKLWLSSNRGIMRFDRETHEVSTYLPEDGVTHEEFNTISHLQTEDGTIYFGGLNGITSFHPKNFELSRRDSKPLRITSVLRQEGESGDLIDETEKFQQLEKIVLEADDLGFNLEFSYMDFQNSKNRYAYRILGIDKDWNYLSEANIRIGRLPYGNYQLEIRAEGSLGVWEQPTSIRIEQRQPIYLEWWFMIVSAITIFRFIWEFIRFRTRQLKRNQKILKNEVAKRTSQIELDKEIIAKQAKDLKELDKLKSKFFANISHELRTPLTLVLGPISQLLSQKTSPEQERKLLLHSKRNGESLLKKVNEILDLSKMESNKLELKKEVVEFYSFAHTIFENFQMQAELKGVNFEMDFQIESDFFILADSYKVSQILNNLLSNALKFTPSGKNISCKIWEKCNRLNISVSDTGIGISEADLPHVFERFYQSKNTKSSQTGTGIGLALSKELSELMNGNLEVESKLGEKTIFNFSIPINEKSRKLKGASEKQNQLLSKLASKNKIQIANRNSWQILPASNPDESAGNRHQVSGKTQSNKTAFTQTFQAEKDNVLIVEDNSEMQDFISSLLQEKYNLLLANNGLEAIEILNGSSSPTPQLILSDVMMPEMDGFELLDWVKSDQKWRATPIVMLTARIAEEDKLHALTTGVDDYITKPFSPQELLVRIKNLLVNSKERRAFIQTEFSSIQPEIKSKTGLGSAKNNDDEAQESNSISEVDQIWVAQVEEVILEKLGKNDFGLQAFSEAMNLSERQFRRNLKKITGLSPIKFQQEVQLQKARSYLERGTYQSVSEVSYAVGFQTVKYFAKLYKARFGKNPSEELG
ncbi:MAG: signal transduction histidine kinase/DNA-binding response OmpR family regulator [Arenicella sp.]|jgi:signal transduction histidine kinase/DNA-binding response OmpR family regulator